MGRRFSKSLGRKTHGDTLAGISTLNEDEAFSLLDSLKVDPFLLILDQVQDPRNFGACLRSADAAGVNLVIMPSDRSAGLTDGKVSSSVGAWRKLYCLREWVTLPDLGLLKERSVFFGWNELIKPLRFMRLNLQALWVWWLEPKVLGFVG